MLSSKPTNQIPLEVAPKELTLGTDEIELEALLPERVISPISLLAPTALKAFLAATIGYSLFYICRLSLSVVKGPLVSEGLFTEFQIGVIGSALFYSYAVGKLVNGFLADRLNVRKFAAWGWRSRQRSICFSGFIPVSSSSSPYGW